MASKACPKGDARGGKHKWSFVKNTSIGSMTYGPRGTQARFSLRGIYKCECGADRVGQSRNDAPGSDLRDHIGAIS